MLTQTVTGSLRHLAAPCWPSAPEMAPECLSPSHHSVTPTPHVMLSSSGAGLGSRKQSDNMGVGQREGTLHFSYEETKARDIQQCAQVAECMSGGAGFDPSSA